MKKALIFSAAALVAAGIAAGCSNCCSNGNSDCEEVMEVETVEIVPCSSCHQKHKCKTLHKHNKNCKEMTVCSKNTACSGTAGEQEAGNGQKAPQNNASVNK